MNKIIAATAAAMFAIAPATAFAQGQPGAPQQAPTCAEALPQIEALVGQASQAGLQTDGAEGHVETAQEAQTAENEQACIEALVMAQNEVLAQVPQPEGGQPSAPSDMQ